LTENEDLVLALTYSFDGSCSDWPLLAVK